MSKQLWSNPTEVKPTTFHSRVSCSSLVTGDWWQVPSVSCGIKERF